MHDCGQFPRIFTRDSARPRFCVPIDYAILIVRPEDGVQEKPQSLPKSAVGRRHLHALFSGERECVGRRSVHR
jgi:hypothetical protein